MITVSSMRLSSIAVAGLLLLARSTSAFCPNIGGPLSLPPRARFPMRFPAFRANEFDFWWEERRARHAAVGNEVWAAAKANAAAFNTASAEGRAALRAARAKAASEQAARAATAPNTLQLDEDFWWSGAMLSDEVSRWSPPSSSSVALVLTEFVRSDYARQVFNYCRVAGTDYGQIRGMFESVRLVGTKLELKPKQACANVEGLFDRLAKYLRARIPQIKEIHEMTRDGSNIH